jgi:hypothetical protein
VNALSCCGSLSWEQPQLHRHQVVVGRGEPRSGKAHQHAAFFDPAGELLAGLRYIANIGKDQHRQALLDKLADRLRRRAAVGEPHVRERAERAREIIGRG